MPKDDHVTIRIDTVLKTALLKLARKQNRTLSNLIETVLQDYVEKQQEKKQ